MGKSKFIHIWIELGVKCLEKISDAEEKGDIETAERYEVLYEYCADRFSNCVQNK